MPWESEGKQNPRNYFKRIREEWNTITAILWTLLLNTESISVCSSLKWWKSDQERHEGQAWMCNGCCFQKEKQKIQAWNKDDSGQTERTPPAVLKNQKCHEGDEHRISIHTLCQHEHQSIRWMLLLLANACAATGHCRGQKCLNGARNQLGKGIGENPVKGY